MHHWHDLRNNMWKIPFNWLPGSWGLRGKTYEIAQAEYELSGIELDQKLAEIEHRGDHKSFQRAQLDILKKHGQLTQEDYDTKIVEIDHDDDQGKKLAKLDVDLKHKKIDQITYDKKRADILGEPWVSMPKIHWDPLNNGKTFFELDYNEHFLSYLKKNGYDGADDEIINRWLNDICMSITEEFGEAETFILPTPRPKTEE